MDNADDIEKQIQAAYEEYQRSPWDHTLALTIAKLYEQRKEFANAIPGYQRAFDIGGRFDTPLEIHMLDLQIRVLEQQIVEHQEALDAEKAPPSRAKFQARIDALLDELQAAFVLRKKRKEEHLSSLCDWVKGPLIRKERKKEDRDG